jgi:hypothetical protein
MREDTAEEAEARAWLEAHADDPLVKDASLPRDHKRAENGEGLDPSHGIFSWVPHGHRRLLSLDAWPADWFDRLQVIGGPFHLEVTDGLSPAQLDRQVRIGRALALLTPWQQKLLRMKYLEGMTYDDIMRETDRARGTIEDALTRAARSFERALERTWEQPYDLMEEVFGKAGPVTPEAAALLVRLFGNTPEDYEQWSALTERSNT